MFLYVPYVGTALMLQAPKAYIVREANMNAMLKNSPSIHQNMFCSSLNLQVCLDLMEKEGMVSL
jgi:hypothetical protein